MLGCVKEVADFEVTVSLPCCMQGFLSIKNISDSYTKLLSEQLESDDTEVGTGSNDVNILSEVLMMLMMFCNLWFVYFAGHLLSASPLLPRHVDKMCGCQVGHSQGRLSQHPAVSQSKAGQQGSYLELSESWHGESLMSTISQVNIIIISFFPTNAYQNVVTFF